MNLLYTAKQSLTLFTTMLSRSFSWLHLISTFIKLHVLITLKIFNVFIVSYFLSKTNKHQFFVIIRHRFYIAHSEQILMKELINSCLTYSAFI